MSPPATKTNSCRHRIVPGHYKPSSAWRGHVRGLWLAGERPAAARARREAQGRGLGPGLPRRRATPRAGLSWAAARGGKGRPTWLILRVAYASSEVSEKLPQLMWICGPPPGGRRGWVTPCPGADACRHRIVPGHRKTRTPYYGSCVGYRRLAGEKPATVRAHLHICLSFAAARLGLALARAQRLSQL